MIKKAFVSGQMGQALFWEEDRLRVIDAGNIHESRECSPFEETLFFNGNVEIDFIEDIALEALREDLFKKKSCFDGLNGAIGGLDKKLPKETRVLSMQRAETLYEDNEVAGFIKARLFGNAVPYSADLLGAVKLSGKMNCPNMHILYGTLAKGKDNLENLLDFFRSVITDMSLEKSFVELKNIFVKEGYLAQLFMDIVARLNGDSGKINYSVKFPASISENHPYIAIIFEKMKFFTSVINIRNDIKGLAQEVATIIVTTGVEELAGFSLKKLEEITGVEEDAIRSSFVKHYDFPLDEFILRTRMHHAAEFVMNSPHLNDKEISEKIGLKDFESLKSLCKEFFGTSLHRIRENFLKARSVEKTVA